uniref:MD-2-related lipid-recognition domain-containing protein n=1 Tax=Amphimedon queenslandica TaxID=400682 RepID=A0A1X7VXL2_AMPQE
MKTIITTALLLVFNLAFTESNNLWTDCSSSDDKTRVELTSISVAPILPKKGQYITVNFELIIKEEITSGEVSVKLIYSVMPIIDEDLDLCNLITQFNTKCPLEKGTIPVKVTKSIPNFIPSGLYKANINATDQNNKQMFCVNGQFNIQ